MGSFSWTRADTCTARSNLTDGDKYKILVPAEYGGGYVRDIYFDYGYVFYHDDMMAYAEYVDGHGVRTPGRAFGIADLYGILAWWNKCDGLLYDKVKPETMYGFLKFGKTTEQNNRSKGFRLECSDEEIESLRYPLKLVSHSFTGTYEACKGISYPDPEQGLRRALWSDEDYIQYRQKMLAR